MAKKWQLQEARNRFSQVVNEALSDGPQVVTRRGEEVAVIISMEEYRWLKKSQPSLLEFFQRSPLVGVELDLERDQTFSRDKAIPWAQTHPSSWFHFGHSERRRLRARGNIYL